MHWESCVGPNPQQGLKKCHRRGGDNHLAKTCKLKEEQTVVKGRRKRGRRIKTGGEQYESEKNKHRIMWARVT